MIAGSNRSGPAARGRLENLLQWICGHPRDFTVEHQVLNWLTFFGIFMYAFSGVENTLLGISPTWILFAVSGALLGGYYLVRVRRSLVRPFGIVVLGGWLLASIPAWLSSDGIGGSTPLFMILAVTGLTIFLGWARWLVVGLVVVQFAALTGLQIVDPQLITPYASTTTKYVDIAFSFGVVVLYEIGYIAILTYNMNQRRRQADELLLNILPRSIAEQLKYAPNQIIAQRVPQASVLFADLADFTPLSAGMTASELVELLDEVFSQFDILVEQRGLEKIKTIGDCYMVAAGVPQPRDDHAGVLADLALEMQEYVHQREIKGKELTFRIGINSGPLIAGVIGRKIFIYDLWGDTVNTASRMESHGVNGRIQVTEATYQLVQGEFSCEPRGMIPIKGKGEMPVWFVVDRKRSQRSEPGL